MNTGDRVIFKSASGKPGPSVFVVRAVAHNPFFDESAAELTAPNGKPTTPFPLSMLEKTDLPFVNESEVYP